MKELSTDLQVLSMHMMSAWKIFNEVIDYVKKIKGVQQLGQAKALAQRSKNAGNFSGSYSKGSSQQVYSTRPI